MSEIITQRFVVSNEINNPVDLGTDTAVTSEIDLVGSIGYVCSVNIPAGYRFLTVVGAVIQATWEGSSGGYETGHYSPVETGQGTGPGFATVKFVYRFAPSGANVSGNYVVAFVKD